MLRLARSLVFISIFALTGLSNYASAHPVTRYQWFTSYEISCYNEVLWWTPQVTFRGPYRTNDGAGFYGTHLYGQFISSASDVAGDPIFHIEPIFNAPRFNLGTGFNHLQENATTAFPDSLGGRVLPRVVLNNEDGLTIYSTIRGIERDVDSVWATIDAPLDQIIYFPCNVEVEGVLSGRLTIYSRGSIYLTDNIIYSTSNLQSGLFFENSTVDMLALVADENVIIKNTWANGRQNMSQGSGIAINGSIIALGESFTFEQQNDDWDLYQGPEPDERGYIYHKGSIAQHRRGYTYRSNHGGTGYGKAYYYDSRLLTTGPPGFAPGEYPYWEGQVPSQHLGYLDEYTFENATLDTLTIDPGVIVLLEYNEALTIGSHFEVNGTAENPVVFRTRAINGRATVRIHADAADVVIRNARFEGNVELISNAENTVVDSCEFDARVLIESENLTLTHNTFGGQVSVSCHSDLILTHNLILSSLSIPVSEGAGLLMNNTIVGSNRTGISILRAENLNIVNNIIAFNQHSIDNHGDGGVSVRYCNVFGNLVDDYFGCQPGEGCLSLDPLFVDARNGDYRLAFGSPCIDAGDPDSPNDPDGSRADMGAYPFDHAQDAAENVTMPSAFALASPFPNPFNSTTTIGYSLPVAGNVLLAVYDLSGRELARLVDGVKAAGMHEAVWQADGVASGVYVVKLDACGMVAREKVVLVR